MLFFFDNNLSPFLARALDELCKSGAAAHGVRGIHHLRKIFPANTPDVKWIENLSQRKERWAVVTSDQLKKGRAEKELVKTSGLVWFFLAPGWSKLGFWTKSWKLIKAWSGVMEEAQSARNNSCFLVHVGGKIVRL